MSIVKKELSRIKIKRFFRKYKKTMLLMLWVTYIAAAYAQPLPEFMVWLLLLGALWLTIVTTVAVPKIEKETSC